MKHYVILRVGFSYNDEIYSIGEDGKYSKVEFIYHDKAAAMQKCLELNYEEIKDEDLDSYGYSDDDIFEDGFAAKYKEIFKEERERYGSDKLSELTLPQYKKLAPFIKIRFFEVKEVNGE